MFRLFLIISLLFTIGSCSNTRQDKNNLKISSLSNKSLDGIYPSNGYYKDK